MPAGHKFLGASIQGSATNVLGKLGGAGGMGGSYMSRGDDSDTASQRNNVYATPGVRNPQSRKSVLEDEDAPNTDEFQ